MRGQSTAGVLTAILLACVGCTSWPVDCTSAGGLASQVRIVSERPVEVVEFCLDGHCTSAPHASSVAVDDDPASYEFRLLIAEVAGARRVIVGTVNTEEYLINGKGCEPRSANASLSVDRDGGVSITHP